jgi:hypothetical protein
VRQKLDNISEERNAFLFVIKVEMKVACSSEIFEATSYDHSENQNLNNFFRKINLECTWFSTDITSPRRNQ